MASVSNDSKIRRRRYADTVEPIVSMCCPNRSGSSNVIWNELSSVPGARNRVSSWPAPWKALLSMISEMTVPGEPDDGRRNKSKLRLLN